MFMTKRKTNSKIMRSIFNIFFSLGGTLFSLTLYRRVHSEYAIKSECVEKSTSNQNISGYLYIKEEKDHGHSQQIKFTILFSAFELKEEEILSSLNRRKGCEREQEKTKLCL